MKPENEPKLGCTVGMIVAVVVGVFFGCGGACSVANGAIYSLEYGNVYKGIVPIGLGLLALVAAIACFVWVSRRPKK